MVLQNIDIIHGRPSFRATFLIAMVNASGRFTPLQFRMEGKGKGETRSCVAHCKVKETGEEVEGPEISMTMARDEGWSTKAGSKWKTMPELMLRYRAAAFFARIYAPDITLGMHTAEEIHDIEPEMRNATPKAELPNENPFRLAAVKEDAPQPAPRPTPEAEVVTKDDDQEQSDIEARNEARFSIFEAIKETAVTPDTFFARAKKAGWTESNESELTTEDMVQLTENAQAIADGVQKGGAK